MLWSLPLATPQYPLPNRPVTDVSGQVVCQAYQYNIANISARVLELDDLHLSVRSLSEVFSAVMDTDQELRSLANLTPESWWRTQWVELSIDALLQYWHLYLTLRAHLQLALAHDEGQQFAFSFVACLDASKELTRRYLSLRPLLPVGFFVNWVRFDRLHHFGQLRSLPVTVP